MPVPPMFPLGTVLVPGMILPLHVFEPRYRAARARLPRGRRRVRRRADRAGVRGRRRRRPHRRRHRGPHRAGRRDRPTAGTRSAAVGMRRIRVTSGGSTTIPTRGPRWSTGPTTRPAIPTTGPAPAEVAALVDEVGGLLRRAAALQPSWASRRRRSTSTLADDPLVAGYQATALGPARPGRQAGAPARPRRCSRRLEMLRRLLGDARRAGAGPPGRGLSRPRRPRPASARPGASSIEPGSAWYNHGPCRLQELVRGARARAEVDARGRQRAVGPHQGLRPPGDDRPAQGRRALPGLRRRRRAARGPRGDPAHAVGGCAPCRPRPATRSTATGRGCRTSSCSSSPARSPACRSRISAAPGK